MFTFLLSIIVIFITSYSYGIFFKKFFIKSNKDLVFNLGETIILGYFFLLIISLLFHFFIPINYFFTIFILLIALCYFSLNFYTLLKFNLKNLLIIFSISFLGFVSSKSHPDFEWYHLPYLNYLQNYKIVFGIGNLSDFLGYSQTWNDIIGIFRIPIVDYRVANFAPIIFCISIVYSILHFANISKFHYVKVFIYLILIFIISKYYKFDEYGGHIPPIFLGFLINIYFFIFIIENNKDNEYSIILKIFIFSFFLIFLRANYIFILPIIIYFLIFKFKIVYEILLNKKFVLLVIFVPSIFVIKNIIVSGCIYYPIDFSCISNEKLSWSIGKEYAKERFDLVKALSRGWSSYITLNGNIPSRLDYFEPMLKGLIMKPAEYLAIYKNTWFKYWLNTGDAKKLLNNIFIMFFCFLVLSFKSGIFKILSCESKLFKKYIIVFVVFLIQIYLCYKFAPQTIYGADVVTVVFLSLIVSFFLQNINLNYSISKFLMGLLFFISISYFEYKNIFRLYEELKNDNIFIFRPWLNVKQNILGKDYYKYSINKYQINVKNKKQNRHIGLPDYCGNIPMFCLAEDRKLCIENIEIKKGYYFIKGNNKECLKHLKSRYFY